MLMGILLHAANVYAPAVPWIVDDREQNVLFDWVHRSIHLFRMPAFFWISGYFCAMAVRRNGVNRLLESRMPRLLIPLGMTLLTLNALQEMTVAVTEGKPAISAFDDGLRLYHLWFLVDLAILTAAARLFWPIVDRFVRLGNQSAAPSRLILWAALVMATYGAEALVRATGIAHESLFGLTNLYRLIENASYFFVGLLMYGVAGLRPAFTRIPAWVFWPALVGGTFVDSVAGGATSWYSEGARLFQILAIWLCVASVVSGLTQLFKRPMPAVRKLSEASYTIYLFHHLVLVGVAIMLLPWAWGPWIKFGIVCVATMGISLSIHALLVRPNRWLSLLFNGKRL